MAADVSVDSSPPWLFREGVESVERMTSVLGTGDWDLPACGRWTGTETARHLLAVARWYHEWLDRAVAGDASPPFPASEMDKRNSDALATIGDISGPEAISEFADTATAYLGRATNHWNLAYGYPYGTVTVGLHCGVAATEWHLHAWDLSHTLEYRRSTVEPPSIVHRSGDVPCRSEERTRRRHVAVPRSSRGTAQPLVHHLEEIRPFTDGSRHERAQLSLRYRPPTGSSEGVRTRSRAADAGVVSARFPPWSQVGQDAPPLGHQQVMASVGHHLESGTREPPLPSGPMAVASSRIGPAE